VDRVLAEKEVLALALQVFKAPMAHQSRLQEQPQIMQVVVVVVGGPALEVTQLVVQAVAVAVAGQAETRELQELQILAAVVEPAPQVL
jgi:hypothetical protein